MRKIDIIWRKNDTKIVKRNQILLLRLLLNEL